MSLAEVRPPLRRRCTACRCLRCRAHAPHPTLSTPQARYRCWPVQRAMRRASQRVRCFAADAPTRGAPQRCSPWACRQLPHSFWHQWWAAPRTEVWIAACQRQRAPLSRWRERTAAPLASMAQRRRIRRWGRCCGCSRAKRTQWHRESPSKATVGDAPVVATLGSTQLQLLQREASAVMSVVFPWLEMRSDWQ